MNIRSIILAFVLMFTASMVGHAQKPSDTPVSQMEKLDRGLIVVKHTRSQYFISWRYLGTDDANTYFEVLRNGSSYRQNIYKSTCFNVSSGGKDTDTYQVVTWYAGQPIDTTAAVSPWTSTYLPIPLDKPADGTVNGSSYSYTPNDCSVGDVDGDGQYEIILKWDPSNSKDNASSGYTGNVLLDCYKLDGTKLWRIDLGKNIRAGAHYTQFMVFDFDGDGKAEMMCKTAPGSVDGAGKFVTEAATLDEIKNADNSKDYRNTGTVDKGLGHVLDGPEYLTVFSGLTGEALHTVHYNPSRGGEMNKTSAYPSDKNFWNDAYGNRADRFLACVAYLDGPDNNPSGVFCRGYYTKAYFWAVDFDGMELKTKWVHASVSKTQVDHYDANFKKTTKTYSSNTGGTPYSNTAWGNGNHNISVGDVDGDGKDEILYGSSAVDDNGELLYAVGFGHGDAMHLCDIDPDRPGLELFDVHEEEYLGKNNGGYGFDIHDAATGKVILNGTRDRDTGRGLVADYDSNYRGCEYTYATQTSSFDCKGNAIYNTNPGMNFRIFWDADPIEELLDGYSVTKASTGALIGVGRISIQGNGNNSTKNNCNLSADILGDWREEIVTWADDDSGNPILKIYSTAATTNYRVPTLMHDHLYRMGICWQNVAYNQPPHLGYYLPDFIDSFQGNDPSTGIVEIEKMRNVDNEIIYNLQGQRVKNVSHGIFVRGGKKFMVK